VKIRTSNRVALVICSASALLAGCGEPQPPIGAPGVIPQSLALSGRTTGATYKVVYRFKGDLDGYAPEASLIDLNGKLYGTTIRGGGSGNGTVFRITAGGNEKVLHSFAGRSDGRYPAAALIKVGGAFYGTTQSGGVVNCYPSVACGTVFSMTASGTENVLYSFAGGSDGAFPDASMVNVNGALYGTTGIGGAYTSYFCPKGCGTVFSITLDGAEKVVHSFGAAGDGEAPAAGLIEVNGKLYGTTVYGGTYGSGTVFSITPGGKEKVLHSFAGGSDGAEPFASLIEVNGTLYGTTYTGGAKGCNLGCGTVFSITPSGTEKVMHNFGAGTDGGGPVASLVELNGKLYGTTAYGGAYQHHCGSSCLGAGGTVFSLTLLGTEKVLHSFANGTDGSFPGASLTNVGGTLYGTTENGGGLGCQSGAGCGTVFALTP
jgi:uncharacterized repeat protein (TIGR03803 family)